MAEKKSVPITDVMGLVLQNVIQAEAFAARESLRYIQEFGFINAGKKGSDDLGELRYIQFQYAAWDADGKMEKRMTRIPLLSLMQIPMLSIDDSELEFALRVDKVDGTKEGDVIYGMIDSMDADSSAESKKVPRIKVKMKLKPSDLPSGVSVLLRKLNEGSLEEK